MRKVSNLTLDYLPFYLDKAIFVYMVAFLIEKTVTD